jgi:hypothetical protein
LMVLMLPASFSADKAHLFEQVEPLSLLRTNREHHYIVSVAFSWFGCFEPFFLLFVYLLVVFDRVIILGRCSKLASRVSSFVVTTSLRS